MEPQTKNIIKGAWVGVLLALGLALNAFGIGRQAYFGFSSVGNWLVFIAFVSLALMLLQSLVTRKRVVDERMLHIAAKANRVTFVAVILFAVAVMIVDGLRPITVPYSVLMNALVCGMLLVYAASYQIMLKYA